MNYSGGGGNERGGDRVRGGSTRYKKAEQKGDGDTNGLDEEVSHHRLHYFVFVLKICTGVHLEIWRENSKSYDCQQ